MWSWGRLGTRPQTMSRSRLDARSEGRGSMLDLDLDLELDSEPRSRSSSTPELAQVLDLESKVAVFPWSTGCHSIQRLSSRCKRGAERLA